MWAVKGAGRENYFLLDFDGSHFFIARIVARLYVDTIGSELSIEGDLIDTMSRQEMKIRTIRHWRIIAAHRVRTSDCLVVDRILSESALYI